MAAQQPEVTQCAAVESALCYSADEISLMIEDMMPSLHSSLGVNESLKVSEGKISIHKPVYVYIQSLMYSYELYIVYTEELLSVT
jgi:hypothetical protein